MNKSDRTLRNDLEAAMRKHAHPLYFFARDVLWARVASPSARLTWRALERSGPFWTAVTAVATALTAWATLRGR
jgi:hypothetical protein